MKTFLLSFCLCLIVISGKTQHKNILHADEKLIAVCNSNISDAVNQYKFLAKNLPAKKFPKTYFPLTGKYEFSNAGWWCSGFYPGTLLYLFQQTKDSSLYNEAERIMKLLKKEQYNTSTHDLGFMMYCSFGNEYRIHPTENTKAILLNSAKSLSGRFNPTVGCIKSWETKPSEFYVIIDNMMNLELLFWATKVSGDSSFYKIAVTHANTTMKNHFRNDYSSFHVVNYNVATGEVLQRKTVQGFADSSAWSRGQAWGLYGYTVMYRETKDIRYLKQAEHIADYILNHPNYPSDGISYWDFNAPNIPKALKDASAAAIMASAWLELCQYSDAHNAQKYFSAAETILRSLSTNRYKAKPGTNGGFILKHSVGHIPNKTEIDVPLTYADYYFVEAMQRYLKLTSFKN
ncbi:unsaturated chondroitin disaccharide hydrolase [mine drainage metagenome]|uniref:Unsaturated chondroitin disaccharide hydrolase n=1 Tax=mine drainage metagenome TaxID=410659 RepID=A0A1J5SWJ9_9ZZZZ